jgi:hypothetical protein
MASKPSSISEQRSILNVHCEALSDLLNRTEQMNKVKKRERDLKTPTLLQANEALAEPMKIPGINYLEININGRGFERNLVWQLSSWSLMQVLSTCNCAVLI